MIIECEPEESFSDYRESILMNDKPRRCAESGALIPAGMPIALCEGSTTWDDDGFPVFDFATFQCIEVWRWARSLNMRGKACFSFEGIGEELGNELDFNHKDHAAVRWMFLEWRALVKRVKARYAEGKGPRLHRSEREALEGGKLWDQLPANFKGATDAQKAGLPWIAAERED